MTVSSISFIQHILHFHKHSVWQKSKHLVLQDSGEKKKQRKCWEWVSSSALEANFPNSSVQHRSNTLICDYLVTTNTKPYTTAQPQKQLKKKKKGKKQTLPSTPFFFFTAHQSFICEDSKNWVLHAIWVISHKIHQLGVFTSLQDPLSKPFSSSCVQPKRIHRDVLCNDCALIWQQSTAETFASRWQHNSPWHSLITKILASKR